MTEATYSRKKKKTVNPVSIICKGILIILLVINLVVIGMGRAYKSESVGMLPYSVIPILSDSMNPKIKSGDAVLVKQVDYEEIVPGDIVVYQSGQDLIVHEVISKDDNQFVAKGIENTMQDIPVSSDAYRAKFIFRIPLLGGVWRISGNPLRFILLAILIGLILFGDQIFSAVYTKVFDRNSEADSEKTNNLDKE